MDAKTFDMSEADVAWCPGCGNFAILKALKAALVDLELSPTQTVLVSGIGQGAKIPHYLRTNVFNGLHGRALPAATAIKVSNRDLTVVAESGDGDMYGEGGNHFIHTIRRNPDITNIVHDNMVYGLTKGQASPTSLRGFVTSVQLAGVFLEPFNPLAVAIALDAGFVARAYSGNIEQTKEVLKQAINHKGYALVDLLHPCVSFNKLNTSEWYKENTYELKDSYDPTDRKQAFSKATETHKLGLGIFYRNDKKLTFEENIAAHYDTAQRLYEREVNTQRLRELVDRFRTTL